MAGTFELFLDAESRYRFRLRGPGGAVVAVSRSFDDKPAAVAGIRDVRECAGTALITDLSSKVRPALPDTGAFGSVNAPPAVECGIGAAGPGMVVLPPDPQPADTGSFPGSRRLVNAGMPS